MNFNPYSNPNFGIATKRPIITSSSTTTTTTTSSKTPQKEETIPTPVSNTTNSTPTETNRSRIPKLDAAEVKNLSQEIEEELSSPKNPQKIIVTPKPRARSQSRLVNLEKDSDEEEDEEEDEPIDSSNQIRTILTVEVTVIKPGSSGWKIISNSSLLSLYSSERKQALTSEVEIPTELALWKESQKKKGFDLYLFLKLNENVQFQILKSISHETNKEIGSSYLVIKYVDKRSEKIQFIGLIFSSVTDLQSTFNLLQRCIVSVPTIVSSTPSKSVSSISEEFHNENQSLKNNNLNNYKKDLTNHIQNQILYHTKQMCYHELQKEELLKQLQKLENE